MGLEVARPSLEDCLGVEGREEDEILWDPSKLWCSHGIRLLGEGTPAHESTQGSFHYLLGILKIIAHPSFFLSPDFGLICK